MNGWIDRWMDGQMDEWMDEWIDRWMNGWIDGYSDIIFLCYLALEPQHLFKCQGTFVGHKVSTFNRCDIGTSLY